MSNLTVDQMLAGRKRPQASIPICLRLDVMSEIEELERAITAAQGNADDDLRMAGSDVAGLADQIRALEEIAREYTIDLRVQALDKAEWAAKVAQFTEEDDDGNSKLDMGTVVEHILHIPGVVISPEMSDQQLDSLITGMSDGQWETVLKKVFELNRRTVTVGKSLTASLAIRPKSEKRGPDGQ